RAANPVISPSRGPGPRPAPMYMPVATPFSTTPDAMTATCTGSECGGGTTARTRSITAPTSTTLHSVPRPGRCRSGIQSSSTTAPTMIAQVPTGTPVRPASSSIESLIPYRTRPAKSWTRRRGIQPGCQLGAGGDSAGPFGIGPKSAERARGDCPESGPARDAPGVEGHPDAGDLAVLDVHPVRHRDRGGHAGGQVEPGQHVRLVMEYSAHVKAGHDLRHALQPAQAVVAASHPGERPGEVHVVGQHRTQPAEVPRLP